MRNPEHRSSTDTQMFVVIGTVKGMKIAPRSFTSCFLRVYRFNNEHTALQLVHKVSFLPLFFLSRQLVPSPKSVFFLFFFLPFSF
jgi:hypothetical protein